MSDRRLSACALAKDCDAFGVTSEFRAVMACQHLHKGEHQAGARESYICC